MINKQTYSILQFCEAHNISRAKFYLLLNEGKAPRLMKVGRRRLVSMESAADWRKMMEASYPFADGRQHACKYFLLSSRINVG